jgi:hypothetical protein
MIRLFWVFAIALLLTTAANIYLQQRIERRIGTPSPAVVNLSVIPAIINPVLCPGDTLRYLINIDVQEPAVIELDASVRYVDTKLTVIPSVTRRIIYDSKDAVRLPGNWAIPDMMPATSTRPQESPWIPGQYRRLIALTGIEGNTRASVASVDFRIGEDCRE